MEIKITIPAQTIVIPSITTKTAIWKTVIPSQNVVIPSQEIVVSIPENATTKLVDKPPVTPPPIAPDIKPPSVPQNLVGQWANGILTLSWSKSTDDLGVDHYVIKDHFTQSVGFEELGKSSVNSFTKPATEEGEFNITVQAVDLAGNKSADSARVVVKVGGAVPPTPTPGPGPIIVSSGFSYGPTSWPYSDIQSLAKHSKSDTYVSGMVKQGSLAWGRIELAINKYTVPNIVVTEDIPLVSVQMAVWDTKPDGSVEIQSLDNWSDNAKFLKAGIRIPSYAFPALMAGNQGLDASFSMQDLVHPRKPQIDIWQLKWINGQWYARNAGIVFDAPTSDAIMPLVNGQWNSATATGLPNYAITIDHLKNGIPFALPFADTMGWNNQFVWPANRADGSGSTEVGSSPYGQRFRLNKDVPINQNDPIVLQRLMEAAKKFGMIRRDWSSCIVIPLENIQYKAPAVVDRAEWAWEQYKPFFGGMEAGQFMDKFPLEKLEAVA